MATLPSATASRGRCCVDAQAACLPQHGFPSESIEAELNG
jgi:hypothetical protein